MNLITFLFIVIGLITSISILIIRNMVLKFEKQQTILISYLKYLNEISTIIEISDKNLREIDARGHFEADDEIGWFFKRVKDIQEILNNFQIKDKSK